MKLSERLQAMCSDFEHMGVNEMTVSIDAIREAIDLSKRVEGATEGFVERLGDCPVRKRPRALVVTTREAIINGSARVHQMVRLVPEVGP